MKELIRKLFKPEPQFSYIIAEYQPAKKSARHKDLLFTELDLGSQYEKDEMHIDGLYQNS